MICLMHSSQGLVKTTKNFPGINGCCNLQNHISVRHLWNSFKLVLNIALDYLGAIQKKVTMEWSHIFCNVLQLWDRFICSSKSQFETWEKSYCDAGFVKLIISNKHVRCSKYLLSDKTSNTASMSLFALATDSKAIDFLFTAYVM